MVSIGKASVGKELVSHLELEEKHGDEFIFADPHNALYDELDLNRGLDTMAPVRPSTAFAFLDRFTKPDGMKELNVVLGKWINGGVFIPPKMDQSLIQGGTFIFDGPNTLVAHYDESVGDHAKLDTVIKLAKERTTSRQEDLA
mmetsp:Transcript_15156/g.22349  ORF Transcript_15156/g.22349 Transcript_15156/m.22349 type:complete len:143 (-) Transcript_15156:244-672(-)